MEIAVSTGITPHYDAYPFIAASKFTGSLTGKVVLITGASRGIGRATALAFAAAGAHVAGLSRTSKDIDSVIAEIKSMHNVPALAVIGDVLSKAKDIVDKVEKALGPIDVLVNNAGIMRVSRFEEEVDLDFWWRVMEINVRAPIALIHAVTPSFIARGRGTIITLGSAAADIPLEFMSSYSASKAAVIKAIQIIDLELKPKGILNFVIHPGSIKTSSNSGELSVDNFNGKEMQDMMDRFASYMTDTADLPAQSMVALAALGEKKGDEVKVLSGRYFDCHDDLGEILEKSGDIEKRGLYQLRIRKL